MKHNSQRSRKKIERIDREIIALLARREALSRVTGKEKRARGLPVRGRARERVLARAHVAEARRRGLPQAFVRRIFALVLKHSRDVQKRS